MHAHQGWSDWRTPASGGDVRLRERSEPWVAGRLGELRNVLDAVPAGGSIWDPEGVWTGGGALDSRELGPGQIFFALAGERTDGHFFVREALGRGAALAVVEAATWKSRSPETRGGVPDGPLAGPVLMVPAVAPALQELARWHRSRMDARVLAVTGTTGKTTTKELLGRVLSCFAPTYVTRGNLNNHLGVPLTLLELRPEHRLSVVEMGASRPGEIALLARLAQPELGVITSVSEAHLESFGTMEEVLAAKWELASYLGPGGTVIINGDDDRLRERAAAWDGPVVTYGFSPGLTLRGEKARPVDPSRFPLGASMLVDGCPVHLRLPGRGALYAALATLAVARLWGFSLSHAAEVMATAPPLPGRLCPLSAGETTLIDDTYNASPGSVANALEVLAAWPCRGRRVAVLGDMLELGEVSPEAHREVGRLAAEKGTELLFIWGDWGEETAQGAFAAGMDADRVRRASDRDELARLVSESLAPGDVVLLKSSRRGRLEEVAATLIRERGEGEKREGEG